jgi:DcuC family C4-dicarboxylate transporter
VNLFTLIPGLIVIALAVYGVVRRVDVRLVLIPAALVLGTLAGQPALIVQKFLATLADERYVVPICTAMGFAYVLRHTECDQHLVWLLVKPLRRARVLVIPGAVLVGFLVNIPVISQTSTAVAIGFVLIPLLFAARISPVTAGAALLLGSSVGGELLNPGAPEYGTVVKEMAELAGMAAAVPRSDLVQRTLPLCLAQLLVATAVFWAMSVRAEARWRRETTEKAPASGAEEASGAAPDAGGLRVNLAKAAVPIVPLALLFLTSKAFDVITLPQEWLVSPSEVASLKDAAAQQRRAADLFDTRLIGAAMLIGVVAAVLTTLGRGDRERTLGTARAFFDGAGFAFAEIIAIIVAASCFAEGVKLVGVGALIGALVRGSPALLLPAAGVLPMAFAAVSGSGIAATQGLYGFFAGPALDHGLDPAHLGSVVSLGAAAGRTLSLVAAVTLMSAKLSNTSPADLVKRVAPPLIAGVAAMLLLALLTAPRVTPAAPAVPAPLPVPRASQAR